MAKEIRLSDHALFKMALLSERGMIIAQEFIIETIRFPDRQEPGEGEKITAQKQLNENLVLRVVYREYEAFILVITMYPARRSRYEKS
ncbi:DUF4258 domain-containing protein [Microseira wollei]|jgi:hypothetical protein|uniref:DUF4258 domain-containing protein n=1 Tax=Microseira wollei NIES-4236 TaxID=2530354 RepID=A0AAV3XB00_9CYAN|nr:DUF4258 domain-containing protein [Microseira wollei]GET38536.1 hypothetical protein MiSe_32940 [Microseira wollei NIES-4236]